MSIWHIAAALALAAAFQETAPRTNVPLSPRERISLNQDWRFIKGDPAGMTANLDYDRIKQWILPTGNSLIRESSRKFVRPEGNSWDGIACLDAAFDDAAWRKIDLPHDWGIEGPFMKTGGGSTGRLPFHGVAWYRKKFELSEADAGKSIFLDVDGAMSYAAVWINGRLAGG